MLVIKRNLFDSVLVDELVDEIELVIVKLQTFTLVLDFIFGFIDQVPVSDVVLDIDFVFLFFIVHFDIIQLEFHVI